MKELLETIDLLIAFQEALPQFLKDKKIDRSKIARFTGISLNTFTRKLNTKAFIASELKKIIKFIDQYT